MDFKYIKISAIALAVAGMCSCSEKFSEELNPNDSSEEAYAKVLITLSADKNGSQEADGTRVHLGEVTDGDNGRTIKYHWDDNDQIGIFAFNSGAKTMNYASTLASKNQSDLNLAWFSGYIDAVDDTDKDYDLLVYYPYNASLVTSDEQNKYSGNSEDLINAGLTYRLQSEQKQSVYGLDYENDPANHPSMNISKYGLAFDLVDCNGTTGTFTLHHKTTYLQLNVAGGQGTTGVDYHDASYKLVSLDVSAGHYDASAKALTEEVYIAGTYTYTFNYDGGNGFGDKTATDIVMNNKGGSSTVSVTLEEPQPLNGTTPVFAVINTAQFTDGTDAIRVVAHVQQYDESGNVVKYITRTRYYGIGNFDMAGGDYYNIAFTVADPVDEYTRLDAKDHSNCYIVPGPGKYTFNVNIPGNGQLPYGASFGSNGIPAKEFFTDPDGYALDYLWASGTAFEAVKAANPSYTDNQVVGSILKSCTMSGSDGILAIELADAASSLSGNIVVALHKQGSQEIIWSWHLWLGNPVDQYFKFSNTRPGVPINNEDWYMLDRNIGAESASLDDYRSDGLYYQLGRKDPFIGPNRKGSTSTTTTYTWNSRYQVTTYRNTETFGASTAAWSVDSSIAAEYQQPMHLNYGHSPYTYAWVQADDPATANSKTLLDPCPVGYKLPITREWDNFKNNEFEYADPESICSGPFGYSTLYGVKLSNSTDSKADNSKDPAGTFQTRMDDGNYYSISSLNERTYRTVALSGTGNTILTTFPNTGIIAVGSSSASYTYLGYNFALWSAGRIDKGTYTSFWFGVQSSGDYAIYDSQKGYNWIYNEGWRIFAPFTLNITTGSIGSSPASIESSKSTYAAPVRCIREYNSSAD